MGWVEIFGCLKHLRMDVPDCSLLNFFGVDEIYYIMVNLSLGELEKIRTLNKIIYEYLVRESFWIYYMEYNYRVQYGPIRHFYPEFNARQMCFYIRKLLESSFSKGSIIAVESLVSILTPSIISKLCRPTMEKFLLNTNQTIYDYIFKQNDIYANSIEAFPAYDSYVVKIPNHCNRSITFNEITSYLQNPTTEPSNLLKILIDVVCQPTEYFTPNGIVTLRFNANVTNLIFVDNDNKEVIPYGYDDLDSEEYDRDTIHFIIEYLARVIYDNYYSHISNQSLILHEKIQILSIEPKKMKYNLYLFLLKHLELHGFQEQIIT